MTYSQIWLNLPKDDCHFFYIFLRMMTTLATKKNSFDNKNTAREKGEPILYINSRSPSVRLSETTVPRYNAPAEPSCQTDGQTDRRSEFIGRYMQQQQQWRRSGKRKERMKLSLPSKAAAVEALRKKGREDETQ